MEFQFDFNSIVNMVVAAALSAVIGLERELRHQDAGLRTHMLVGLGAALFASVGIALGSDPTRIAAQVVSGIGFLGAGAIFRSGETIRGLTTAAGLWVVASIGVAAGSGLIQMAVIAALVGLAILHGLAPVVDRISDKQARAAGESQELS
ncbi:MAG TPA: MgtC/SapB family protein [Acidimicrobiia bacterium]|nr:MgtC/SapB family protein [Acidimicrobiia bacterium]